MYLEFLFKTLLNFWLKGFPKAMKTGKIRKKLKNPQKIKKSNDLFTNY